MIRIGSTTNTGVQSLFNDFHATTTVSDGFFTNSTAEGPPPPTQLVKVFGSQYDKSPLVRLGGTVFVDPYGVALGEYIDDFYITVKAVTSSSFQLSWSKAYGGTVQSVIPDGQLTRISDYFEVGDLLYFRFEDKTTRYRMYSWYYPLPGGNQAVRVFMVGPLNFDRVTAGWDLRGLAGVPCGIFKISTPNANRVDFTKDEVTLKGEDFPTNAYEIPNLNSGTSAMFFNAFDVLVFQ